MTFLEYLASINACNAAKNWVADNNYTSTQAWENCTKVEWLLWWINKDKKQSRIELVQFAIDCARLVLHLAKTDKALLAVEAAEKWIKNPREKNRQKSHQAARNCYAADAADAAAAYAAYAAYAADADSADAAAAYAYAYAADASADAAAAYAADAYAALDNIQQQIRSLVYSNFSQPWKEDI